MIMFLAGGKEKQRRNWRERENGHKQERKTKMAQMGEKDEMADKQERKTNMGEIR